MGRRQGVHAAAHAAATADEPDDGVRQGLEDELGWSLHRVLTGYSLEAVDAVADLPGTARGYQVLVAVEEGPPTSQMALARRLGIDKTIMTYLVDDLEGAGLVTRRPDPVTKATGGALITPSGPWSMPNIISTATGWTPTRARSRLSTSRMWPRRRTRRSSSACHSRGRPVRPVPS